MDSSINLLPKELPSLNGISLEEGCKKHKLSSDVNVADYQNPFAISNVQNCLETGEFGSVTKDIEALVNLKMQIMGPYLAKHPKLINQFSKGVTNHDEETPISNTKINGISSEEGCKKHILSSDVNVVDYQNPFAISDVLNRLETGEFGSVTKDIEALVNRKMQIIGPCLAKHPKLINQFLKEVTNHDEETPTSNKKN